MLQIKNLHAEIDGKKILDGLTLDGAPGFPLPSGDGAAGGNFVRVAEDRVGREDDAVGPRRRGAPHGPLVLDRPRPLDGPAAAPRPPAR